MTGGGSRRRRDHVLTVLGFAVLTLGLALAAYWDMFEGFSPWDDEGTMLITIDGIARGGSPYADVFTQYGPFWIELFGGLFAVTGWPVGMDAGRAIVAVEWVACSVAMGVAVRKLCSSALLGLAASIVAFDVLRALVTEPMHPSSLVCVLLTAMVVVVAFLLPRAPAAALAALGALAAALALTKINAGGFLLVAALVAFVSTDGGVVRRRFAAPIVTLVLVGLPVLLMGAKLADRANRDYAWLVASGGLALALVVVNGPLCRPPVGRGWTAFLAGAAALTIPVVIIALAMGTGVADLVDGVIVRPTELSDAFSVALLLPSHMVEWALLAVTASAVVHVLGGRASGSARRLGLSAAARLLAGLAIWFGITGSSPVTLAGALAVSVLLAWVAAIPTAADAGRDRWWPFGRVLLVAAAVTESLQAFPVAGSQVAFSVLLIVPVGERAERVEAAGSTLGAGQGDLRRAQHHRQRGRALPSEGCQPRCSRRRRRDRRRPRPRRRRAAAGRWRRWLHCARRRSFRVAPDLVSGLSGEGRRAAARADTSASPRLRAPSPLAP